MEIVFSEVANLPTQFGLFKILGFKEQDSLENHCCIFKGELEGQENVILRVHSECITGEVFTSMKCDCGEQLIQSLQLISKKNKGVLIYLRQEGRGIGLINKINAYALQDEGLNTIEANHSLGFKTDLRDYSIVAPVINYLNIKSIVLLSNNPEKKKALINAGVIVKGTLPLIIEPNENNRDYLRVKKEQLNHSL